MPRLLPFALLAAIACSGGKSEDSATTAPTTGTGTGTGGTTNVQPPNAQDDLAQVDEGGTVIANLSSNDITGTNGLALGSITIASPPQFGTVSTNTDGTVEYVHDGSEVNGDSFTYTIEDTTGVTSNVANVIVEVAPVNDAPVATDDSFNVDQSTATVLDLAANDTDADDGIDLGSIAIVDAPAHATITVNNDGTVEYDHDGDNSGADSFTYTLSDIAGATSNTATVTLTVNTVNTPPTALDDALFVSEGGVASVDVSANDIDVDDGLDLASVTIVAPPNAGSAVVTGGGSIEYTHDGSETLADTVVYTISDLAGNPSNQAVLQVLVTPVNDPPVASDDTANVTENATENVVVLSNDSDVDGVLDPATVTVQTQPAYGALTVLPDGSIDYTHDGSQQPTDSFTYTVADDDGAPSNVATVDLAITLVNDPPIASDDSAGVDEGSSVTVDLVANDIDTDDAIDLTSFTLVSAPSNGTVVDNGNGTVDYTHDGSETATDSFAYTFDDAGGNTSNTALVSITVNPVNDPPSAAADFFTVDEGSSGNFLDLTANDTDPDDPVGPASIQIVSPPSRGNVFLVPGGVAYDHDGSEFAGDGFTYTITDPSGAPSGVASVTVNINPVNDPPSCANDAITVPEGGGGIEPVLANDTDPDDGIDDTTLTVVGAATNGSTTVLGGGALEYVHDGSETGSDLVTYQVSDFSGASCQGTLSITVSPVNDPPTANPDSAVVNQGSVVTVNVVANDTDPDNGLNLGSVAIQSPPTLGSAIPNPDGTVSYTSNAGAGIDTFTYTVQDASGATSNSALVTVSIAAVAGGGRLYVIGTSDETLKSLDLDTLALTTIGNTGMAYQWGGLTWDSMRQTLYGTDGRSTNTFFEIDPNTGLATAIGAHGVTDVFGMAHDPVQDVFYANTTSGALYTIDRLTGAATLITPTTVGGSQMDLAYNRREDQLLLSQNDGSLHELDKTTGAVINTIITAPGVSLSDHGTGYDVDRDLIWHSALSGEIYQQDPYTGGISPVGVNVAGTPDGGAVRPAPFEFQTSQRLYGATVTCSSVFTNNQYTECQDWNVDGLRTSNGFQCGPGWFPASSTTTDYSHFCQTLTGNGAATEVFYDCDISQPRMTFTQGPGWQQNSNDNGFVSSVRCYY